MKIGVDLAGRPDKAVATFCIETWAGRSRQSVEIVGETAKNFRVRALPGETVRLAGRRRSISGEATALIPKKHLTLI